MNKDLNKVQMTGRLGADPEMRFTPQGHAVTTFRVASNRSWRTPDGESREDTEWFRVVAWNKLAEICNQWLAKGSRVYVEGRMQTRQWQDQEGQTRYLTEVIANDMIILDGRRDGVGLSQDDIRHELTAARAASPPAASDRNAIERTPASSPPPTPLAPAARDTAASTMRSAKVASLPRGKGSFEEEDLPF
jgi:single-strand DNA-binding protein